MPKQSVVIIGSGPAGLSAAVQLVADKNRHVTVVEAAPQVGGMSRSITLWNQRVDIGPHRFFSFDRAVNEFWQRQVGDRFDVVQRLTRILYGGKFFFYPLRLLNTLRQLGVAEAVRCLLSYMAVKISPLKDESHFEGWVSNRFGRRLFAIFFRTYSEKLWGIPCDRLDAEFAVQRIKQLSLLSAIARALLPSGQTRHKSLIDEFKYPHGGTGSVYERMASSFVASGGTLRLTEPVQGIALEGQRVRGVKLQSGEILPADWVISSMPLHTLVQGLPAVPNDVQTAARSLKFRNTVLVYLRVSGADIFPDQWVYVHSPDLGTGRITNFRNWSPTLYGHEGDTILALEYWCNDDDERWTASDERLVAIGKRELASSGLLGGRAILAGHVLRLPKSYPIYERGYREKLDVIRKHLTSVDGLIAIGRGGAFKYNNQDHSILMGLLAARVVGGEALDLWSVNNDYEYQEAKA